MYFHAFAILWKPGVQESQKQRARTDIGRFQGQIPGLLGTYLGTNTSPRGHGHELGCVMKFADKAALDAYRIHPEHLKLIDWLRHFRQRYRPGCKGRRSRSIEERLRVSHLSGPQYYPK